MITAFLLFPVMGVLSWLYWRLLPGNRRWRIFDSALFADHIEQALARAAAGAGPVFQYRAAAEDGLDAVVALVFACLVDNAPFPQPKIKRPVVRIITADR